MAIDWRTARPGRSFPAAPAPRLRAPVAATAGAPAAVASSSPPPAPPPDRVRAWPLLRGPAFVTLAVTLLRLAGEKLGGPPELFGRVAGGGLAYVGIAWLVPVFGFVFGWKLQRRGLDGPAWPRLLGLPALALLLPFLVEWAAAFKRPLDWTATLATWGIACLISTAIAALAWLPLGRLLFGYALLARLPVVAVTGAAMAFGWGTHYDALPPGFPQQMPLLQRWLWLGLLPQATIWVAFTVSVGLLCGVAGWWAAKWREA